MMQKYQLLNISFLGIYFYNALFFNAGNILNEFTESLTQKGNAYRAHDRNSFTCFKTVKQDPWWSLELGANVRVSMVFISTSSFTHLEGVDILVGECVL